MQRLQDEELQSAALREEAEAVSRGGMWRKDRGDGESLRTLDISLTNLPELLPLFVVCKSCHFERNQLAAATIFHCRSSEHLSYDA